MWKLAPALIMQLLFVTDIFGAAIFNPEREPMRIASLAPGITETLYALGLGSRVVGDTSFCSWPPEAADKPKVAGFRDINIEALIRTMPDLAILPDDMAHYKKQIEQVGIPVMLFDNRTLAGFLEDVLKLGKICGKEEDAEELHDAFSGAMAVKHSRTDNAEPAILFALMNPDECMRPVTELTILGNEGFYNELVEAAGGKNAYTGRVPYPRLSAESLISLKPDILAVSAPECPAPEQLMANWRKVPGIGKTAENLLLLDDPGDTIPGPRSLKTLEKLSTAVKNFKNRQKSGE